MQPTVCRTVLYKLHAGDVEQINRRREDFAAFNRAHRPADHEPGSFPGRSGHVGHFGNQVTEGEEYPAVVVRTFGGSTVNLHVLLDGNDTYWATSRSEGDEPGNWSWPPVPAKIAQFAAPIESRTPRVGDTVHYVSYGTPGGEYGKECRAAIVTELTEVEVNERNPSGDGIFRQTVGLYVMNPSGQFFNRGVVYVPGTFRGASREAVTGEPLQIVTCADLEFAGGTWHWPTRT